MSWWQALAAWAWGHRKEIAEEISDMQFPEEPSTPLPYSAVEHQRAQERAATSHKVKP